MVQITKDKLGELFHYAKIKNGKRVKPKELNKLFYIVLITLFIFISINMILIYKFFKIMSSL